MNRFLSSFILASAIAVLTVGCGSSVKLDDVPVEDKAGQKVQPLVNTTVATGTAQPVGSSVGQASQTAVAPIDASRPGSANAAAQAGSRFVYFDYDSYSVKPEFQSVIESHARYLRADKNRKMAIEGHTDERGGREYNLSLGQRRAEAVRKALELLGVSDSQIEAVSFGKEKPAVEGADEAVFAKNRRTEIIYR